MTAFSNNETSYNITSYRTYESHDLCIPESVLSGWVGPPRAWRKAATPKGVLLYTTHDIIIIRYLYTRQRTRSNKCNVTTTHPNWQQPYDGCHRIIGVALATALSAPLGTDSAPQHTPLRSPGSDHLIHTSRPL